MKKNVVYIIHGKTVEDCIRIQKDNNLNALNCVHVLTGYESGLEQDTATIKHIWAKTVCPVCNNTVLAGRPCPYCVAR